MIQLGQSIPAESGNATQPSSILIVDDNSTNRIMLSRYVSRLGYKPTLAENGKQALEKLKREPFDLVLLDVEMPELNGYEVLAQLKTDLGLRDLPVIMISALEELESVVKCIELGAEDYLPKPFNPILLKARINASLARKSWHDQEQTYLRTIQAEQAKSEALLLNILPRSVAEQLKAGQKNVAESFEAVTVLFADIVSFTPFASQISASELVELLNKIFTTFDNLVEQFGLEKIKTIGDAYMAVAGLPVACSDHAQRAVELALAMQEAMPDFSSGTSDEPLKLRIGLHSGPVIAGIIGTKKIQL